eukprot:6070729-Prymnesium_polylepis.4
MLVVAAGSERTVRWGHGKAVHALGMAQKRNRVAAACVHACADGACADERHGATPRGNGKAGTRRVRVQHTWRQRPHADAFLAIATEEEPVHAQADRSDPCVVPTQRAGALASAERERANHLVVARGRYDVARHGDTVHAARVAPSVKAPA